MFLWIKDSTKAVAGRESTMYIFEELPNLYVIHSRPFDATEFRRFLYFGKGCIFVVVVWVSVYAIILNGKGTYPNCEPI